MAPDSSGCGAARRGRASTSHPGSPVAGTHVVYSEQQKLEFNRHQRGGERTRGGGELGLANGQDGWASSQSSARHFGGGERGAQ